MDQIMKLIYANSQYVTIHFELYRYSEEEFPIYLELVHNTDDESVILFIVKNNKDFEIN